MPRSISTNWHIHDEFMTGTGRFYDTWSTAVIKIGPDELTFYAHNIEAAQRLRKTFIELANVLGSHISRMENHKAHDLLKEIFNDDHE